MSVLIVAEAGVNHLGERAKMYALCDAAKMAGADAVKFQAYDANALRDRRNIQDIEAYHLLRRCQLSDADLDLIAAHCEGIGIKWFASVFDPSQIERVLSRGACALKIGHAEAEYGELIQACARRRCPKYISGRRRSLDGDWVSVHGVWEYPAESKPMLGEVSPYEPVWCNTGFSSHYTDYRIPAAAALRGADYIEAHLRIDADEPEAAWSLSPDDFAAMVKLIREYESWL